MRNPIILCSTRLSHYAIENEIRYELDAALVLKLKQFLKANLRKNEQDIVSRWVANLPENTQKQIRVYPFHSLVA